MNGYRRNSIFGLLSFAIPVPVLLIAYPVLIARLGADVVGVYLLSTTLAGVWAMLDFGVSAATVKFVAEDMARDDRKAAAQVVVASLLFYGALGVAGTLAIWFASPWLVGALSIGEELEADSVWAFRIAGLRFAAYFVTVVLISLYKGLHRFEYAMGIVSVLSVITLGGATLGVVAFGMGLIGISVIALAANLFVLLVAAGLAIAMCRRHGIPLGAGWPTMQTARRIFSFSLFIGLNSIAYTFVTNASRMVLSAFLGPAAVTAFSIASTLTWKGPAAFYAMFEFLLPGASALMQRFDKDAFSRLRRLYLKSLGAATGLAIAGYGVLYALAPTLVHWWLDSEIDPEVAMLIRVLCVGAAIGSIVQVNYHVINGIGRPATNTVLFALIPVVMYVAIGILSLDGVTTLDFALSQSLAYVAYGAASLLVCEFVIWRHWIPAQVRAPVPGEKILEGEAAEAVDEFRPG